MRTILVALSLVLSSSAFARADGVDPAWRDKNRHEVKISNRMPTVAEHGAPTTASAYDMGQCAMSIVNFLPAKAKRILDEAIARGERAEFYKGAEAYVAKVQRDPVPAWAAAHRACTGEMLQRISFEKQDRQSGEKK